MSSRGFRTSEQWSTFQELEDQEDFEEGKVEGREEEEEDEFIEGDAEESDADEVRSFLLWGII